jgi:diadenosine tetraphosphate (Ap4A) HIT family hydrolase
MTKKILFPNEEVFNGKYFNIHQDWEVPIPAFFVIESKRKINSFMEFTENESLEFMRLIKKVRTGMKEALNIKDVYFFQNEDSLHGFHLWIFPRHAWMEKFGKKIQSVRPIMNYAKKKLTDDKIIKEVKTSAKKIRTYMEN